MLDISNWLQGQFEVNVIYPLLTVAGGAAEAGSGGTDDGQRRQALSHQQSDRPHRVGAHATHRGRDGQEGPQDGD